MKQIAEFTAAEQADMAVSLRPSATRNRNLAAFKGLTKKQARAYLDRAAAIDTEAATWEAAAAPAPKGSPA